LWQDPHCATIATILHRNHRRLQTMRWRNADACGPSAAGILFCFDAATALALFCVMWRNDGAPIGTLAHWPRGAPGWASLGAAAGLTANGAMGARRRLQAARCPGAASSPVAAGSIAFIAAMPLAGLLLAASWLRILACATIFLLWIYASWHAARRSLPGGIADGAAGRAVPRHSEERSQGHAALNKPRVPATLAAVIGDVVALARRGAIVLAGLAGQSGRFYKRAWGKTSAIAADFAIGTPPPGEPSIRHMLQMTDTLAMAVRAQRRLTRQDLLMKLLMDKLGAILLLMLASPMLAAIALAVLVDTPGPVIFRQERSGRCGRLFTLYKFRTMLHTPGRSLMRQTMRCDPRVTATGGFLRRTSLDELPQLWNVLRGDMSLVGPRPHADGLHLRECGAGCVTAAYLARQRVKPGMTGWAQIHGARGAADTPEKLRRRIELDLYYIENWSIWLDVKILALTPRAVWSAENAF
jgi:lipopolysaccharide/colanic/teichoic acid biosynthesis glycosyltransferase